MTRSNYDYVMVRWIDQRAYAYCDYGHVYPVYRPAVKRQHRQNAQHRQDLPWGGNISTALRGRALPKATCAAVRRPILPTSPTAGSNSCLTSAKNADASGVWKFPGRLRLGLQRPCWWYCANKAGIYGKNLDTTANTFYHSYCAPIEKSELRPGDAVFYQNSSGKVTHMAFVGEGGVVYEAMSGYTGVVMNSSVGRPHRTPDRGHRQPDAQRLEPVRPAQDFHRGLSSSRRRNPVRIRPRAA